MPPEQSAQDQPNPPPEREQITVPASMLAWGNYNHERERDENVGPIHSAYSADLICEGKARRPFRWQGHMMVTTSLSRMDGVERAEAYRLLPENMFTGTPTTLILYFPYPDSTDIQEGVKL